MYSSVKSVVILCRAVVSVHFKQFGEKENVNTQSVTNKQQAKLNGDRCYMLSNLRLGS